MNFIKMLKTHLHLRENLLVNIQGLVRNYSVQSINGIYESHIIITENNGQMTCIFFDKIESVTVETFRDDEHKPYYYYDNVFITTEEELTEMELN